MLNRLRRKLDRGVALRVTRELDDRGYDREKMRAESAHFEARLADYEARLGGLQADYSFLRSEFDRIAPQLAALEYRFEVMRQALEMDDADEDSVHVRAQLEHERARMRLELVSQYEERLRRLEAHDDE